MICGFIALLSSLARVADPTKFLFFTGEPCLDRPAIIDMNSVELKYYPFIVSLNKCTENCNVFSPKICVPKEIKDILTNYVKALNMITNKNEAKAITEHISCDCKCKSNSATCNSKQKWNNKTCQCKNYCQYKENYSWNPSICICENNNYLKSIADTSVMESQLLCITLTLVI